MSARDGHNLPHHQPGQIVGCYALLAFLQLLHRAKSARQTTSAKRTRTAAPARKWQPTKKIASLTPAKKMSGTEDVELCSDLLPFQQQILADLSQKDGLVVIAPGLDVYHLLFRFLRPFTSPKSLVFVLNLSTTLEQRLNDDLLCDGSVGVSSLKIINHEFGAAERFEFQEWSPFACLVAVTPLVFSFSEQLYLDGGCFSVTSRILAVDMLNGKVPLQMVTGMVVINAHRSVIFFPLPAALLCPFRSLAGLLVCTASPKLQAMPSFCAYSGKRITLGSSRRSPTLPKPFPRASARLRRS